MSVRRENTFRIDYANVPKKPSFEELHEFVGSALGLKFDQVVRLQPSRTLGCAFVKVVNLELAQKIVAEHDNKHETEVDGKIYKLRITLEDGAVEVKLTDLSEDVTDEQIVEFLCAYGEVLSIQEQMWDSKYRFAGSPTGTRIVRMMLKRNIESYVTIDGQTTNVTFFGQLQTCRYCNEFVHNGISCVQNKKLLVQKTYANVAKQTTTASNSQKPNAPKPKIPFAKLFGPKPKEANPPTANLSAKRVNAADLPHVDPKPSVQNSTEAPPVIQMMTRANLADKSLMPSPAFAPILPSRMTTRQTSDGNETDISSASANNKRRSKKFRHSNNEDEANEETHA